MPRRPTLACCSSTRTRSHFDRGWSTQDHRSRAGPAHDIVAHGAPIESGGHEAFLEAYAAWL